MFSDKTGTLTQNLMKLRHWYIQGRIYDENEDGTFGQLAQVRQHAPISSQERLGRDRAAHSSGAPWKDHVSRARVQGNKVQSEEERLNIVGFMRAVSVCHAVIPSVNENSQSELPRPPIAQVVWRVTARDTNQGRSSPGTARSAETASQS